MRPLTLTVEGLRSFRQRVQIDFKDRQLVAIVGDTGVGKSSLLEAITYALYSGATWTAHSSDLISDTARDMLVELTFVSDNKTYTVRRSSSRGNRPATAQLLCHDDDRATDNVRAVNDAIVALLGLDRDTFLKTVILPQGRFAELLTSTPGERNTVLRNIFRVDVLDTVRELTKSTRDRLYPHVQGIKQRLAVLPDDPVLELKEAKGRQKEATAAEKQLSTAFTKAKALDKSQADAAARVAMFDELIREIDSLDPSEIEVEVGRVLAGAKSLADIGKELEKQEKAASSRIKSIEQKRSSLTADGLDAKALTKAHTTLKSLAATLPDVLEAVTSIRADGAELMSLEHGIVALAAEADRLKEAAAKSAEVAKVAADATKTSERAVRDAETAYDRAIEGRTAREEIEGAIHEANERLSVAQEGVETATASAAAANEIFAKAADDCSALERQHAAAHAAASATPGNPCPICERPLPTGFRAPKAATGLEKARSHLEKSEKRRTEARAAAARASQAIENARERLADEQARLKKASTSEASSTAQLVKLLGVKDLDLRKPRNELLAAVTSAYNMAVVREAEAEATADVTGDAAHAAATKENEQRLTVQAETKRLREKTTACERQLRGLSKDVAGLPEVFRPDLGDLTALQEVDESVLAPGRVGSHLTKASAMLKKLEELEEELQTASEARDAVREQISDHKEQLVTDVNEPMQELLAELQDIASRLAAIAVRVGTTIIEVRVTATHVANTVKKVAGERSALSKATRSELVKNADAEEDAQQRLQDLLGSQDIHDLDEFGEHVMQRRVEVEEAKRAVAKAEAELAIARDLQVKLGTGGQLVDDLEELRKVLSAFISDVLSRRSLALLAVASQRLGDMTGGRFAFTEDFDALDELTGQPRRAETLSGGESFLASLALALGMVDLAARAGGRLEALFLDEGFGALDNSNLSAAIDALEATAQEGRMVAVVSHVKAVADRIDDVMVVVGKPRGSQAVWLDEAERDGLRDRDLAAALSGLLD